MEKRLGSILLTLLLAFVSAFACAEEQPGAALDAKADWTVLIYLCGTDLESEGAMATYNLEEIAKTTPNDRVNVVVETGGAAQWHAEERVGLDIAADRLQRYCYGGDGYALVDEQPLDNMAAAGTLTDFIRWGAAAYPAEKTMLVLWDHGGGSLGGLILDELHDNALMPLEQLEIALTDANVPLEALVLDTCLMASLETAQAAEHSAKYLIASEETVPGEGSAYAAWLQYLYNNPACDGARFGRVFCDVTQQKYVELGQTLSTRMLTFSVIDLQRIPAVSAAFDRMILEMSGLLADPEAFFNFSYFTKHVQRYGSYQMVDLADMASRAQNRAISNETASAVVEAVDAAVVYNLKGDLRSYSHGLSFYYHPTATVAQRDHYARSCKSAPYLAFLDAVSMSWTAPGWVYEQTARVPDIRRADYTVEAATFLTAEQQPLLVITNAPHAVTAVDAFLFQYEKGTDAYLLLGEYDKVIGDFDTGAFTLMFPQEWWTLNGDFCQMSIVEETAAYTLYNVPFQTVDNGAFTTDHQFRVAYLFDTPLDSEAEADGELEELAEKFDGHYEFYGVWDRDTVNSADLPSRSTIELSAYYGEIMHTLLPRYTLPDLEDVGAAYSKDYTMTPELAMDTKPLPKGDYALLFEVTDVFGNVLAGDPIYVSWDGKTARYSGVEVLAEEDVTEEAE